MSIKISDKILQSVEKSSRYTGNEWNGVYKEFSGIEARFAFCFPDVYEVGMSHLGMKILYHLLNERENTYCERVFAPWVDMEAKMRENDLPLFSLETYELVKNFDIVVFTLQYEMSYTNIVDMMDLAQIPLLSCERTKEHPFVCAGGPCAYNPEPLAHFIDFFMMGEGEEIINKVMDAYVDWERQNLPRQSFLDIISQIEGIYVPAFYEVEYNNDNTISRIFPIDEKYPKTIRKRIINDLDSVYFPDFLTSLSTSDYSESVGILALEAFGKLASIDLDILKIHRSDLFIDKGEKILNPLDDELLAI